ncbi:RNase P subunit p30 family protein [Natronobiforma cellulositropha]|uniref:RNase P subunit p30 family protein n=1 Tax=Natronobiforma cellulositropha TaxID=1679076 RepID=UPI0021D5E2A1|nr:RNase P subunit p30 family protein [Natronobiforma cellulositropha]
MYESVHVRPDGESDLSRLVETAADYGFEGVVVRNHSDARPVTDLPAVAAAADIDVVDGVEIRADDPHRAGGAVGNFRTTHTVVAVHGGTNAMNRFAVENEKVDVLAHPMTDHGDVNHVLVKAAADNGVRLEFSLAPVLRSSGGHRVRAIQSLRKLRELVAYYDAPYVVSADPTSHFELRAPRELCALGEVIGFSADALEAGLREWGVIAERTRAVRSDSFIEPGVQRGRYEEDD